MELCFQNTPENGNFANNFQELIGQTHANNSSATAELF